MFSLSLVYTKGQTTLFQIIPDDCFEEFMIGKQSIFEKIKSMRGRCDWQNGITIDLKPYLKDGSNEVQIAVRNNTGATGLNIIPVAAEAKQ
jgi:hypothetical protein